MSDKVLLTGEIKACPPREKLFDALRLRHQFDAIVASGGYFTNESDPRIIRFKLKDPTIWISAHVENIGYWVGEDSYDECFKVDLLVIWELCNFSGTNMEPLINRVDVLWRVYLNTTKDTGHIVIRNAPQSRLT